MADHRFGQQNSNALHRNINQFEAGMTPASRSDLFLRSESPRVQQILLHQKLKEDIEKNSTGRIRYVDSELYLRNNNHKNNDRSPSSEIQTATLNIGLSNSKHSSTSTSKQQPSSSKLSASSLNNTLRDLNIVEPEATNHKEHRQLGHQESSSSSSKISDVRTNKNCHVCMVKEVREDLMKINKIVQERNEQITKLKAKCLRSYFERQMN